MHVYIGYKIYTNKYVNDACCDAFLECRQLRILQYYNSHGVSSKWGQEYSGFMMTAWRFAVFFAALRLQRRHHKELQGNDPDNQTGTKITLCTM